MALSSHGFGSFYGPLVFVPPTRQVENYAKRAPLGAYCITSAAGAPKMTQDDTKKPTFTGSLLAVFCWVLFAPTAGAETEST